MSNIVSHLESISAILRHVPTGSLAAAFSGLIARETTNKTALARYLQEVLESRLEQSDPTGAWRVNLDITEEVAISSSGSGDRRDGALLFGFIPSRCHFNDVRPICCEDEIFELLKLKGDEREIQSLINSLDDFCSDLPNPLRCAVHPYADCVLMSCVLFACRKLLPRPKSVQFVPADWADLEETTGEKGYDLSYMSEQVNNTRYRFRKIKEKESVGQVLFHDEKCEQLLTGPNPSLDGYNFNGQYSTVQRRHYKYTHDHQPEIALNLLGMRSDFDDEAKLIIALANGYLGSQVVVPSLQGYLWAVECGFIKQPYFALGTLKRAKIRSSAGSVGYGVRIQGTVSNHKLNVNDSQDDAGSLLGDLNRAHNLFRDKMHDLIQSDREHGAKTALGILKAPVVAARGYDHGLLSRIPADVAMAAALPRGDLFEGEHRYKPLWWQQFEAGLNQECRTDVLGGVATT